MNARYQNKNAVVLGAGLSGTAAALLLKSNGADVTVLDSADEIKLLKSTIDNLRANGVRVITGAAADQNRDLYDLIVLSPGIDPDSHLAQNFAQVGAGLVNGLVFQSGMYGEVSLEIIAQQLLIEAAHVRQNRQLPLRVFDQNYPSRQRLAPQVDE